MKVVHIALVVLSTSFPVLASESYYSGQPALEPKTFNGQNESCFEISLAEYFPAGGWTDPPGWRPTATFGPYPETKYLYTHADNPIYVDDVFYLNNRSFDDIGYAHFLYEKRSAFLMELPAGSVLRVRVYNNGGSYGCSGALKVCSSPLPDIPLPVPTRLQEIAFTLPSKMVFGGGYRLSAQASSRLPVTFDVDDPTAAHIEGNNLSIIAINPNGFVVSARQNGNTVWKEKVVRRRAKPSRKPQRLALTVPKVAVLQASFAISATINSPLPPIITSSNPDVVKIVEDGGALRGIAVGVGKATIKAMQDGNANYAPAIPVRKVVVVK